MIKKIALLFVSFSALACLKAQAIERQVVASSGTSVVTAQLSLSYTIGETFITTGVGTSNILTQGFQQIELLKSGTNDAKIIGKVQLFPNPTKDILTISVEDALFESIYVADILGRFVVNVNNTTGSNTFEFDASTLAQGQYFVVFKNGNNFFSKKFIKL